MVKNSTGGNKAKSKARKTTQYNTDIKLENIVKGEEQEYAKILRVNGGGRYAIWCEDEKQRLGTARGKLNRNAKAVLDGLVLISKRDFQDGICDILYVYSNDEIQLLKKHNQIPAKLKFTSGDIFGVTEQEENDEEIEFGNL